MEHVFEGHLHRVPYFIKQRRMKNFLVNAPTLIPNTFRDIKKTDELTLRTNLFNRYTRRFEIRHSGDWIGFRGHQIFHRGFVEMFRKEAAADLMSGSAFTPLGQHLGVMSRTVDCSGEAEFSTSAGFMRIRPVFGSILMSPDAWVDILPE